MKETRQKNQNTARKTAMGAVLAALAVVLLIIGGIFEILDMTAAAVASAAILITHLEFGAKNALSVYGASAVISFILFPTASSTIYYALLLGYYPIFKLFTDRKFKNHKFLRIVLKFSVFNAGCGVIFYLFSRIYGFAAVIKEFTIGSLSPAVVIMILFVLLNIFLVMYDILISALSVIYLKGLRKRIFPKG